MQSRRIHLSRDDTEDELSRKKGKSKYTEEEDQRILEYIRKRPESNLMSRKYWQQAIEKDNLLDKKRSVESLRERYRNHLRGILEHELDQKPPASIPGQHASSAYKYGPSISSSVRGSKRKFDNQQTRLEQEFLESENDDQLSNNAKHLRNRRNSEHKPEGNVNLTLSLIMKDKKLVTSLENTVTDENTKKRKEYQGMSPSNSVGTPNKKTMHIEQIIKPQLLNQEEKIMLEEKRDWVKECALKHSLTPEQFLDLFSRCSMNYQILEKYLEGYTDLVWDEDEDTILRNPRSDAERKMLIFYKGAQDVAQREKFFEKLTRLRPFFCKVNPSENV